jgi:hypothetical protein
MGAYPTIASRADGSFVTAWAGPGQPADIRADVFARSWDASGNAAGATFRVNTYTPGFQLDPAVSAMDDGRFVVVWTVEPADYSTRTLKGQTFGPDGAPAGIEFPVSASNLPYEEWADVAHGPGGGFVVTWSGAAGGYDGTYNDIRTRRFDGTGAPSGTEIMVNSYTSQNQLFSTIAADGDGSFLVVWQSDLQNAVIGRRIQIPSDELCGDPDESSTLDATDALIELRAAIELQTCSACICDVNGSGAVTAADALIGLQRGVDESKVLSCPVCS